jgi:hypothetical protein
VPVLRFRFNRTTGTSVEPYHRHFGSTVTPALRLSRTTGTSVQP